MKRKRRQRARCATTPTKRSKATRSSSTWEKIKTYADDCVPPTAAVATPPWHLLPWLLLLGFVLRAAVALSGDFIVHPDEIMQYLEPAHGVVFGNSISYWEYYFGARSWLVPYALAGVLFLCKVVGLGEPMYYIPAVRLALCVFSLLIPLCMYAIGRRLFGEGCGRVALLFGVFWYELVGFAHKPMTEFIATALFLLLMTMVLRPQRLTPAQAAGVSAFAVLVVAVRFQYAPLVGLLWLLPFVRAAVYTRGIMFAAAAAAVCGVGVFDMLTWGEFLQSYRINYHYNAALDAHRDTPGSYIVWLLIASGGLLLPALAALRGSRQGMFLLLFMLAVLIPHAVQAHREYRFLFVLTPLWLLLCANFLYTGVSIVQAEKLSIPIRNLRRIGIACWAALVSLAGIANALPWQEVPYANETASTNYPYLADFLGNRDKMFPLYRQLAADTSVRGVKDARRYYSNSGGYYYLHHKVPFYDASEPIPAGQMKDYVSHIITSPPTTTEGQTILYNDEIMLMTEGNVVYPLPAYISDVARNQLVHYDKNGKPEVVEGFVFESATDQYTLWKAVPPAPVRQWKSYRIYLANAEHYNYLKQAMGTVSKPMLNRNSFEFIE